MSDVEIDITKEPFEYFCKSCKQLRLCLDPPKRYVDARCRNCGHKGLVIGRINELDKTQLIKEWPA